MADPLPPLVPAEPCQTWSGVFFVRRCGRPAVARCCRCGVAACQDHLRPAPGVVAAGQASALVCLRCLRPVVQRGVQHDHDGRSTAGSSGATEGGRWTGGGGAFSGGGATGSWGEGAPAATRAAAPAVAGVAAGAVASGLAPGVDPVFTEADYAAFAAMSEADKDEGGPSYDS